MINMAKASQAKCGPRRRALHQIASVAIATIIALALATPTARAGAPWIGVRANHLINRAGQPIRLLGVNRAGPEYGCIEGDEIFAGPTNPASIEAMKRWQINAVRVPLNESCWLGIDGIAPSLSGSAYRDAIRSYVKELEQAGLYVILDLQWAAPGQHQATGIIEMPDAEHAPEFWRSLATEYRNDRSVLFDLYNEPLPGVSWRCWEWGCDFQNPWFGWYRAVGMRELVDVVRSTGARQPLLLGGVDWARDLSGWLSHLPPDPAHAEVASNHTYAFEPSTPCYSRCRATLVRIARRFPVITGELGEGDCRHRYILPYMRWADRHGISYLAWAWNTGPGWTCRGGPSLIRNYSGAPTSFGIGLREHLRALSRAAATK